MNNKTILMMKTLTPTHAGSGTQISYVDLPIQRESHTGFPKIEASTLKGCIRAAIDTNHGEKQEIDNLFGQRENPEYASAVSFSDARLLFFPVKSAVGIFAYITCPYVIQRFIEDCAIIGGELYPVVKITNTSQESQVVYTNSKSDCVLNIGKDKVVLEDYTYDLEENQEFKGFLEMFKKQYLILSKDFQTRALVVSDDDFCQFVKYSTEIATRIKINPVTGTVDNSALFTEEFLPPESILYSVVICSNYHSKNGSEEQVLEDLERLFNIDIFQIGADSTLGKGLVKKILKQVKKHE